MSIEAMKLALEALEEAHPKPYNESVISHVEAITALRTAIEAADKQEPVAQIIALGQYEFPGLEWVSADHSFRAPIGTLLYTTPPAAPVQGQTVYSGDEPAWNDQFEAWWENHGQLCRAGGGDYEKTFAFRAYEAALTTPPAQPAQRQPLTDKKINEIAAQGYSRWVEFARAIEAAHGIGERT